ncbi:hypothetical protein SARC_10975 [Sphaeroforma arctica JP610]|uniref:sn-1-specific diacylglycerol lipase n=1 Tax=Sphaeroforma arctica JP610 TaxID=667725 RepID=A0A0L0FIF2_9EUKA|nr:hypothetical protein SARC_10975 [Sphaeroforma arctica JP610]KNC76530.1 hypothetical protein SARC_10975 [Sphaeroforma arctica JP610]|eukprot:XP_014150432.1 hypothetical protein SARC_10975 [Sphaeroforma arctica JP610]
MTEIALGLQTLWKLQQHGVAPVTGAVIYSIPDELPEVDLYMQYASGAFGWIMLTAMGTIPLLDGIRTDKQAIAHLTRVREEDIVYTQTTSELYRPAYYIALDRRRKKIVLAFRGSSNALDMLTDLNCESIPYSFNGVHGEAHAGFARSAHRLSTELMPIMVDLLRENEGYHVVLTGHSLGAAVATMVALEWAHLFDDLKCYAYAAPACVSLPVSLEAQCVVTSVVLGSDLVPRLSRTSLEYLRDVGLMLGQNQELRHEVIAAVARCEGISTERGDKNDDTDINMDTDTNVDMHMDSTSVRDHRRARDDTNGYMEDIDTDATTSTLNRHESLDGFLGEDLVDRLSLLDRRTSVVLRDDDLSLLRSASESTPHTDTATHIGMHASNTPSRSASCSPASVNQVIARVQRLPNDTNAQTDAEEWVAIEDTVESDTASLDKEQAIQTCRVLYDKLYDAQPNRLELLAAGKILFLCHKTGEGILTNGELAPHWSRVILSRSMFWLHLPGYYTHHINNHNRLAIAAKSG